jgi:hypothetical protein
VDPHSRKYVCRPKKDRIEDFSCSVFGDKVRERVSYGEENDLTNVPESVRSTEYITETKIPCN